MRESSMQNFLINPEEIEESELSDTWEFENSEDSVEAITEEIMPFIVDDDSSVVAIAIEGLLSISNQEIFDNLQTMDSSEEIESLFNDIKKAMDLGTISKDAPWFKTLENKMITTGIYMVGITHN